MTAARIEILKAACIRDLQQEGLVSISPEGPLSHAEQPRPYKGDSFLDLQQSTREGDHLDSFGMDLDDMASSPKLVQVRSRSNSTRRRTISHLHLKSLPPPTADLLKNLPFLFISPEDLQSPNPRFVRRFRFGVAETLNEDHCDFLALKRIILSSHFKVKVPIQRSCNLLSYYLHYRTSRRRRKSSMRHIGRRSF